MNYYAVNTSASLSHYGVLGMKWGIRRYENPDGTLTAEGKRRYGSSENFRNSEYYKKYTKSKKRGELSNKVTDMAMKGASGEEIAKTISKSDAFDKHNRKLTPEEIAAKNRKATMKVAGVALGITAAAAVIGVMAARHSVDKKSVDAGKDIVDRIQIDKIPINTIKIDKFEPKKFEYEKFMPDLDFKQPESYSDRAKKAAEKFTKAASNMNKSRESFDKASVDLDLMNKFFTRDMSTEELFKRMRK